jgi:hypothetical protein
MSQQRYKPGKSPAAVVAGARWEPQFPDFIEPCHPAQVAHLTKVQRLGPSKATRNALQVMYESSRIVSSPLI